MNVRKWIPGIAAVGIAAMAMGCGDKGKGGDEITGPLGKTSFVLTVSATGTGSGTTSPSVGQHVVEANKQVTITATPSSGSTIDKWSTGATGPSCTVTMNSDRLVSVSFRRLLPDLKPTTTVEPPPMGITFTGAPLTGAPGLIQVVNQGEYQVGTAVAVELGLISPIYSVRREKAYVPSG